MPTPPKKPRTEPAPVNHGDDEGIACPVFDESRGRPCGAPVEAGTLTCLRHRARPTRTQLSRNDAARKRYGN